MIDKHTIFEIHRLYREGWSKTKIADILHLNRKTIKKFLQDPDPPKPRIKRDSKLDTFKEQIDRFLEINPRSPATVILQRIASLGYPRGQSQHIAGSYAKTWDPQAVKPGISVFYPIRFQAILCPFINPLQASVT